MFLCLIAFLYLNNGFTFTHFQKRTDFIQMMMNAHNEGITEEEKEEAVSGQSVGFKPYNRKSLYYTPCNFPCKVYQCKHDM